MKKFKVGDIVCQKNQPGILFRITKDLSEKSGGVNFKGMYEITCIEDESITSEIHEDCLILVNNQTITQ